MALRVSGDCGNAGALCPCGGKARIRYQILVGIRGGRVDLPSGRDKRQHVHAGKEGRGGVSGFGNYGGSLRQWRWGWRKGQGLSRLRGARAGLVHVLGNWVLWSGECGPCHCWEGRGESGVCGLAEVGSVCAGGVSRPWEC